MKCPNCGENIKKEQMYCESCGMEIQIVPDFEPEIENKISETLSTVAMDVDLAGDFDAEAVLMEAEEELFGDEKEIDISLQKKKILTVVGFSVIGFIIVFVLFWFVGIYTGNNFSRQVSKGNDFYNKGQYEEALTYYEKALIEEPDDLNVQFVLGDCYERVGKVEQAKSQYQNIVGLDPANEVVYARLIALYEKEKQYSEINQLLQSAQNEGIRMKFQQFLANKPEFNVEGGTYNDVVALKLIAPPTGKIYYTFDGTEPDETSMVYSTPIFLKDGEYNIKAIYMNEYGCKSELAYASYHIEANLPDSPVVLPESGYYREPTLITVEVPDGCSVYYTTDGSIPDASAYYYPGPLPMMLGGSNYKFVSINADGLCSDVTDCYYQLTVDAMFTPYEAIERLKHRLVEKEVILDFDGSVAGMEGKKLYIYNSLRRVDDKNLYFIYEYYQENNRTRNMTGNIYCVNVADGWVYKAILQPDNTTYILDPV